MKNPKIKKYIIILATLLSIIILFLPSAITSPITKVAKFDDKSEIIKIEQIWFNFGTSSEAIPIVDCQTNKELITPEYDSILQHNNPAAYVKGSFITVRVKFKSEILQNITIKSLGSFGGLYEQKVIFSDGISEWINFSAIEFLPNQIMIHNVTWDWVYYSNLSQKWEYIETTNHTMYALNKKPITQTIFKKLANWTTKWCQGLNDDDKILADAILDGFVKDNVVQYGAYSENASDILRRGYGLCGDMAKLFYHACATHGVKTAFLAFRPISSNIFFPRWCAIGMANPGIGRTEFGNSSSEKIWFLVNETYPYPAFYGINSKNDDVEIIKKRVYWFTDGHALNFINYMGKIYLYDLSNGMGPITDVFNFIPPENFTIYKASQVKDFQEKYADRVIHYLLGFIPYSNSKGRGKISLIPFVVNTAIIPNEINGRSHLNYLFYVNYENPYIQLPMNYPNFPFLFLSSTFLG